MFFIKVLHEKPTFSGAYSHFCSFLSSAYKFGIIYALAFKCFFFRLD